MDPTVLVVDPAGRLRPALEAAGLSIGEDGVALVVVDLTAPGATPPSTLRTDHPGVPIVGVVDDDVAAEVRVQLDDYLLSPFTAPQLAARVRFHLASSARGGVLALRDRTVDLGTGAVSGGTALTWLELEILRYLSKHPGRSVAKEELEEAVWKGNPTSESSRVYVGMRRLREKVERDPKRPVHVLTVRGEGYRFEAAAGERPAAAPPTPPASEVPRPTDRFIDGGRTKAAVQALHDHRTVVLVGTVGAGKTRLAQQIALDWRGPAWWVDASGFDGAEAVLGALSRQLDVAVTGPAGVGEALRGAGAGLVVIDGVERIGHDLDLLLQAADRCPDVRWLATSSSRIDGLTPVDLAGLPRDAARALLADRAAAAGGDLRADDPAVDLLLEALDDLPLAIELAAARLGVMTAGEVLEALDAILEDDALDRAIGWALSLRTEDERAVLLQLGTFAGWFDLPAAEALVDVPGDRWLPDLLQALVSTSLLRRTVEFGTVRLALYEPVRHRARRLFRDQGEVHAETARSRLRTYLVTLSETILVQVDGGDRPLRARVAMHDDDLLAAFDDLREEDPSGAARLVLALVRGSRDVYRPGSTVRRLLDTVAAASDELPEAEAVRVRVARGKVLNYGGAWSRAEAELLQARSRATEPPMVMAVAIAQGLVWGIHGRCREALAVYEEAQALATQLADEPSWLQALRGRSSQLHALGELDRSLALSEEGLAHVEAQGDVWRAAAIRDNLAEILADAGRTEEARGLLRLSLEGVRQSAGPGREDSGEAFVLAHLGMLERDAGRLADAEGLLSEALPLLTDPWHRKWQARVQAALAWVLLRQGRPRAASAIAEQAVQPVPGVAEVGPRIALLACELARGRRAEALSALTRARELAAGQQDPRVADQIRLGEALLGEGSVEGLEASLDPMVRAEAARIGPR